LKYEAKLRRMIALQSEIGDHQEEVKKLQKELDALSVRFAEMMMDHEHGVLETTSDKLLIDFVTKTSRRTDTDALKKNHPTVYEDVMKTSLSRKLRVSAAPL